MLTVTVKTANKSLPLISIITIVFNGEKYIKECINSVEYQKNNSIEYIIVDGKSTDNTLAIVHQHKNIVDVLISEKDRGISDAFNKGIALAKGELIGILNSDDFYTDSCLKEVTSFYLKNSKKPGIYYGNIRYFDEDSSHIRISDLSSVWKYTSIYHPSVFVSKTIYEEIGGFSEGFKYTMDAEFLHRAISKGIPFFHINKCLSNFRTTGASDVNFKETYEEFFRSVALHGNYNLKTRLWHCWLLFKKTLSRTWLGSFFYKRKHLITPLLSGKIRKG